jgi:hypothetical protein
MSEKIFANGFLVKSLCDDPNKMYPPLNKSYRGMGRFISWPLEEYDDDISKALGSEAWDKWFSYHNVFEIVPEKEYLHRYVKHCKELGIETMVLMVETPLNNQVAHDSLSIVECLGFDLIGGVHFSYLTMDTDYLEDECSVFQKTVSRFNSNGLCDSIDDVYEHISMRNNLLSQGVNLEHSDWGPFPARLSIVKLD